MTRASGVICVYGRCTHSEWCPSHGRCRAAVDTFAPKAAPAQVEAVQAQPASAPMGQRKWPFVESPGEFTKRLEWAWREFGALLPAVRYVLIESPPQFYRPPAQARIPLSEVVAWRVMRDGGWVYFEQRPSWHESNGFTVEELHAAGVDQPDGAKHG